MARFRGAAEPLTNEGFAQVVDELGVGVAELVALLAVESRTCGFLPDRRPVILFERHWFRKFTQARYDGSHPHLSNATAGGYGFGAAEYRKLEEAAKLNREAALKSASWGAGQVMGFNHALVGWADVESFVTDMMAGEDLHLRAVAGFLRARDLVAPLNAHDWARVARIYNGAAYAKNRYDQRLAGEHAKFASNLGVPDLDVRRAQLYLVYLGEKLTVDGLYGRFSRAAVRRFRETAGLVVNERVDRPLLEALAARVRALR